MDDDRGRAAPRRRLSAVERVRANNAAAARRESAIDAGRVVAEVAEGHARALEEGAGGSRIAPVQEAQLLRAAACDWRLSRGDVGVFAVLLKHCNEAGECFPGPTRMSREARLAKSNVKASLKRLEMLDYLQVHRPGPRKANRYRVLASPNVPDQRATRRVRQVRAELGLQTGLVPKGNRAELGLQAGPDESGARAATGPADRSATGPVGRSQLGLPAGHEVAFEVTSESTGAARPPSEEETAEQRKAKRERSICQSYLEAQEADPQLARLMEQHHRSILERAGLVSVGSQAPGGG